MADKPKPDRHGKRERGPLDRVPKGGVSPTHHPRARVSPDKPARGVPGVTKPSEKDKPKKKKKGD